MSLLTKLESTCEDLELMIIVNEIELDIFKNMQIAGEMADKIATQQAQLKQSLTMNQLTLAGLKKKIEEMKK